MAFPGIRNDFWATKIVPVFESIAATFFYNHVMLPFFPKLKADK
jgi:hypothetical protein